MILLLSGNKCSCTYCTEFVHQNRIRASCFTDLNSLLLPFQGELYASIGPMLKLFQSLAVLEIFHAAVGLVKSNVMITFMQGRKRKNGVGYPIELAGMKTL